MKYRDRKKIWCFPLVAAMLALPLMAEAQQVAASGGGEGSGGGHRMSWTIGQPVIKTVGTGDRELTQGFQQPWAEVVTVVGEHTGNAMGIRAYPNPADHVLNVEMAAATDPMRLELLDASGRLVLQAPSTGALTHLDLTGQSTGHYILRALNAEGIPAGIFKININH